MPPARTPADWEDRVRRLLPAARRLVNGVDQPLYRWIRDLSDGECVAEARRHDVPLSQFLTLRTLLLVAYRAK
jgi:hypothetical protein